MPQESMQGLERVIFSVFLFFLVASCLLILPFSEVNEAKWFVIRVVVPLLGAVYFSYLVALKRPVPWRETLSLLALATLASHAFSFLSATNIWLATLDLSNGVALCSVFFLVSLMAGSAGRRDSILWVLWGIGLATAMYGVAQHFGGDFFPWQEHHQVPIHRGVSFFGNATFSASVLILIIPLSLGLSATRRSHFAGALVAAGAVVMLCHLYFTGARAATLSLFVAGVTVVIVYAMGSSRTRSGEVVSRRRGAAAVLAMLVVLGAAMSIRAWHEKGSDLFAIEQKSGALRLYGWETASRIFLENPVFGVGGGNYEVVSPPYWNRWEQEQYARSETSQHQVHNEYLEAAAERGVLGVGLVIGVFVYALMAGLACWRGARDPVAGRIGLALFATVLVGSLDAIFMFNLQLPGSALVFWVALGLLSALVRSERDHVLAAVSGS